MYSAVARNKRNTVFIILIFLIIIGVLGFAAGQIWRNPSIGFVVLVVAALYALVQYFFASRQAISMSGGVPDRRHDRNPVSTAPSRTSRSRWGCRCPRCTS